MTRFDSQSLEISIIMRMRDTCIAKNPDSIDFHLLSLVVSVTMIMPLP